MDLVEVDYARMRQGIEEEAGKITPAIMENVGVFEKLYEAIKTAKEEQQAYWDYDSDAELTKEENGLRIQEQEKAQAEYEAAQKALENYKLYLANEKKEHDNGTGDSDISNQTGGYKWAATTLENLQGVEQAIIDGDNEMLNYYKSKLETKAQSLIDKIISTKSAINSSAKTTRRNDDYNTELLVETDNTNTETLVTTIVEQSGILKSAIESIDVGGSDGGYDGGSSSDKPEAPPDSVVLPDSYRGGDWGSGYDYDLTDDEVDTVRPDPAYASGTLSATGGISTVGEEGIELAVLPRGTGILPNPITEELWKFGANPVDYLTRLSLSSMATKGETKSQNNIINNEYTNIGTINLPNVQNAKQFVQELKLLVKRTKNT